MSDFRTVKQNNAEENKKKLEGVEKEAEDLANKRENLDKNFEIMINQVEAENVKEVLKAAHDLSDTRFRDEFRKRVEIPTDEIKSKMVKDAKELEAESRKEMQAVDYAVRNGVTDDVTANVRSELVKNAKEFHDMSREAWDTMTLHDQGVNASRLRTYGMKGFK